MRLRNFGKNILSRRILCVTYVSNYYISSGAWMPRRERPCAKVSFVFFTKYTLALARVSSCSVLQGHFSYKSLKTWQRVIRYFARIEGLYWSADFSIACSYKAICFMSSFSAACVSFSYAGILLLLFAFLRMDAARACVYCT